MPNCAACKIEEYTTCEFCFDFNTNTGLSQEVPELGWCDKYRRIVGKDWECSDKPKEAYA